MCGDGGVCMCTMYSVQCTSCIVQLYILYSSVHRPAYMHCHTARLEDNAFENGGQKLSSEDIGVHFGFFLIR